MSTLKVGTIQDHTNSNTAISIDSGGRVALSQNLVETWALNSSFTCSSSDNIVGNTTNSTWRKVTTAPIADRGGNMTVSNGTGQFTFPHVGVFRVMCQLNIIGDGATDNNVQNEIDYSTDSGSNFSDIGLQARGSDIRASAAYTLVNEAIFNVTNASTFRLRINLGSATGVTCTGGSDDGDIYSKIIFQQI